MYIHPSKIRLRCCRQAQAPKSLTWCCPSSVRRWSSHAADKFVVAYFQSGYHSKATQPIFLAYRGSLLAKAPPESPAETSNVSVPLVRPSPGSPTETYKGMWVALDCASGEILWQTPSPLDGDMAVSASCHVLWIAPLKKSQQANALAQIKDLHKHAVERTGARLPPRSLQFLIAAHSSVSDAV